VKLGKTFIEIAMLREAYGNKATYETPELSVKKLRRTNTKKVRLQK